VGAVESALPTAYRVAEDVSGVGTAARVLRLAAGPVKSAVGGLWSLAGRLAR
jgi:hypothetical protein